MYSIMDAVEAAQRRTAERDAMNRQRLPVVPVNEQPIKPIIPVSQGGGGDGPGYKDTRTQHEMYLDAIDANRYVGAIPVVGPIIGVINDSFIEDYEAKNPNMVVGGPNKFSTIGKIQGKGLTVEEQLEAEKAGLGLGKMLGFGEQNEAGVSPPGYTLFDRVFGTTPMNVAKEADYIGVFPGGGDGGGSEGGPIGGYEQEDLSFDSFAGPTGYA